MKERYRNMMEQMKMSENGRNAIEDKLNATAKTNRYSPLRVGFAAACVCLVLMGGVFAAGQLAKVRMGS